MTNLPPQRVSAIAAPADYALPGRPEAGSSVDAFRQTQFMLGGELDLFARAMRLQLRFAQDAQPSRYRTHALGAITALWSRAYVYLGDALLLLTRGSYPSTLPLLRAAVEVIAAQEGLRRGEMELYTQWLSHTLEPDETFKAFEFELGRYFAGEVIASDDALRAVYRPVADFGRPNFGATLLQVAPESNSNRLALAFADASFHLGWAEMTLGWLLSLVARQCRLIVDAGTIFPIVDDTRAAYEALQKEIDAAVGRDDRCRVEETMQGNQRRYLVHNFRRTGSGAPKKVLL